jgi:predicted nucleic acid-binding protein
MLNKSVIIDTSVWLFALRKEFIPEIKDRVASLLQESHVFTTGIINLELLAGTKSKSEYKRLKNRLDALENIRTDEIVWDMACDLGYKLRRKGLTIPYTDILIAGCALSEECILLHADNHFDLIAKHVNLKVESFVNLIKQ